MKWDRRLEVNVCLSVVVSIFLSVRTLLGLDWPFSLGNVYTQT